MFGKYYREPKKSGPLPFHLLGILMKSFKKDHYVSDTGDVVYYQADSKLTGIHKWEKESADSLRNKGSLSLLARLLILYDQFYFLTFDIMYSNENRNGQPRIFIWPSYNVNNMGNNIFLFYYSTILHYNRDDPVFAAIN